MAASATERPHPRAERRVARGGGGGELAAREPRRLDHVRDVARLPSEGELLLEEVTTRRRARGSILTNLSIL